MAQECFPKVRPDQPACPLLGAVHRRSSITTEPPPDRPSEKGKKVESHVLLTPPPLSTAALGVCGLIDHRTVSIAMIGRLNRIARSS